MKRAMVFPEDAMELAIQILGLDEESEYDDVEEKFMEEFHTDLESFSNLLGYLVPMIDVGTSPLSGKTFKGFSVSLEGDNSMFIVKTEV